LLQRYPHDRTCTGKWFPGGKTDIQDIAWPDPIHLENTMKKTAIREWLEETDLEWLWLSLIGIYKGYSTRKRRHYLTYAFKAKSYTWTLKSFESDEHMDGWWIKPEEYVKSPESRYITRQIIADHFWIKLSPHQKMSWLLSRVSESWRYMISKQLKKILTTTTSVAPDQS
jgi:ADP-ribose pyrophosphatase YjhB (NUDIX family)